MQDTKTAYQTFVQAPVCFTTVLHNSMTLLNCDSVISFKAYKYLSITLLN